MSDAPRDAPVRVGARQPEAEHLARRRVAAEAHDDANAVADSWIGRREQCGPGADAHAEDHGGLRARGERRHDRRQVVGPQATASEPGDRRHRHVEARARQELRGAAHAGVVLPLGCQTVDEDQRHATVVAGGDVAVHDGARDGERRARRGGCQRRKRCQSALA